MLRIVVVLLFVCMWTVSAKSQQVSRKQAIMAELLNLLTLKRNYESPTWKDRFQKEKDTSSSENRKAAYYNAVNTIKAGGSRSKYLAYIKRTIRKNSEHINLNKVGYVVQNPISSYIDPNNFITQRDYLRVVEYSLFVLDSDTLIDLKHVPFIEHIPRKSFLDLQH